MSRYDDINPMDLDPDTGRPYSNYSSPSLDTSFADGERVGEDNGCPDCGARYAGRDYYCPPCTNAKVEAGYWLGDVRRGDA